jgi:hypothetical protein
MTKYRYRLADLIAQMTEANRHPEINFGRPVGHEIDYDALCDHVQRTYPNILDRLGKG